MDQVKKRGPKSKADRTKEALDVALASIPPDAPDVEPQGIPPGINDLGGVDVVALVDAPKEDTQTVLIDLPEYLRDCAIPLGSFLLIPADVRGRIESELGCRFDIKSGDVHANDGRVFSVHHNIEAHTLELTGA